MTVLWILVGAIYVGFCLHQYSLTKFIGILKDLNRRVLVLEARNPLVDVFKGGKE
jgi:hypothetical protein